MVVRTRSKAVRISDRFKVKAEFAVSLFAVLWGVFRVRPVPSNGVLHVTWTVQNYSSRLMTSNTFFLAFRRNGGIIGFSTIFEVKVMSVRLLYRVISIYSVGPATTSGTSTNRRFNYGVSNFRQTRVSIWVSTGHCTFWMSRVYFRLKGLETWHLGLTTLYGSVSFFLRVFRTFKLRHDL